MIQPLFLTRDQVAALALLFVDFDPTDQPQSLVEAVQVIEDWHYTMEAAEFFADQEAVQADATG